MVSGESDDGSAVTQRALASANSLDSLSTFATICSSTSGTTFFTAPFKDAAEVGSEIFLSPHLLRLCEERLKHLRGRSVRKRLDGLGEKFSEAVTLRLTRIVALQLNCI